MATIGFSTTTAPHSFPAGTVPGVYRCALTPVSSPTGPAAPAIIHLLPYSVAPGPLVTTFADVPAATYQVTAELIGADGTTVLFSATPASLIVPAPPTGDVTLNVPMTITVTISFPAPPPPVGHVG